MTIIAIGKMVEKAMNISKKIDGVEVINARFIKPFDDHTVLESIKKTKNVITIEDGTIIGGLGTIVKELIIENNLKDVKIKSFAYPDEFIRHGDVKELEDIYNLSEEKIVERLKK